MFLYQPHSVRQRAWTGGVLHFSFTVKALLEYHLRSKEPAFGTAKLHGFRAAQPDRGLKIRIGFWDIYIYIYIYIYYSITTKIRNPQNSIGKYWGPLYYIGT